MGVTGWGLAGWRQGEPWPGCTLSLLVGIFLSRLFFSFLFAGGHGRVGRARLVPGGGLAAA